MSLLRLKEASTTSRGHTGRRPICSIRLNSCKELCVLQMKGRWESNINVWFPFMYTQKWNCYFQNRIIMFCLPVLTLIYLWEIYIFPGSVCLFCCRKICGPCKWIYNLLTSQTHECGNWDWGRAISRKGIHKWDLKGLSYEIDFENVDENWQILALKRAAAGFWIFQRHLWFLVEIKHLLSVKC